MLLGSKNCQVELMKVQWIDGGKPQWGLRARVKICAGEYLPATCSSYSKDAVLVPGASRMLIKGIPRSALGLLHAANHDCDKFNVQASMTTY